MRGEEVLEFALRRVEAEHSESPMYFVLPARRIESRAGMDCSRGVSGVGIVRRDVGGKLEIWEVYSDPCGGGSRGLA